MSDVKELLAPPRPEAAATALDRYCDLVVAAYGDRLSGLYLFGSRARGDHRPSSDADVAVVLAGFDGSALDEKMRLVDLGFDALTDTGLMIQPWPFTEREWLASEPEGRFADLLVSAKRDARPLLGTR
jgi:predicted nucleotidyltransferase